MKTTTAAAAFLILWCANAAADPASPTPWGKVTTELSNITHLHGSQYMVEISSVNNSSEPIELPNGDLRFSAQGDVLGQWIELAWRREDGRAHGFPAALSPGEERKSRVIVTLPANTFRLYRNHEGDLNMRFQYTFACSPGARPAARGCSGESAYWVTPGTSRWVLREGM